MKTLTLSVPPNDIELEDAISPHRIRTLVIDVRRKAVGLDLGESPASSTASDQTLNPEP